MLADPAPVVQAYPGDKLWCSASGIHPIYTALTRNATVLANTTTNTVGITLLKEGNYSCVATNKFGSDTRVISVIFIGKNLFCRVRPRSIRDYEFITRKD